MNRIVIALVLFAASAELAANRVDAVDALRLDPNVAKQCMQVLRQGLQGDAFWPSMHAAEALTLAGQSDEVCKYLAPKLETESDDQRRCGLARELVRAGELHRRDVMLNILDAPDPYGHVHAAESLYKVGWTGNGKLLKQAFDDSDDVRLRLMAAAALSKYGDPGAAKNTLDFIRQTLRDEPNPEIFRIAAWILGRIGDSSDVTLIRSRLDDARANPLATAFLEHALAALGDPDGQAALLQNLSGSDPVIRTYAALFAGEAEMVQAAPLLIRQLNDKNADAGIRAAHALILLSR